MSAEMGAVASLVQDWEGRVWAGLVRKGAARLDGNTWSHFDSASGALPSDLVTCMAVDTARQRLYVGTHGGLAMFDGQDWHDLGDPIAEMPMWMNALAVDDGGGVWVGYYSGPTRAGEFAGYLLRYADGTWEHIRLPAPGAVGALLVDRVGRLWVGLIPGGFSIYAAFQPSIGTLDTPAVCSYHNGEWRSVGAAQGLGVPAILALAEGHDGVIWAAGVVGIGAIDPSSIWAEH
jgi:ligand-binding sensor domain-containing protein